MTRSDERRLIVAFAIAIGIHEVIAGLVPAGLFPKAPVHEVVANARIVQIAVHLRARPTPPPHRIAAHLVPTPRPLRTAERPHAAGGHRAARPANRSARIAFARTEPAAALQNAANGPSTDDAQGAGTNDGGGAAQGSDNGGGDEPCGFVTFSDPHGSQFDPRTHGFWVDIRMSVHFSGGASQSMILDYPWYYPNEAANPWSDQNLRDPNFLPRFQPPPPQKRDGEPALVRYVLAHSTADGLTLLQDCPSPPPSPSV